MARKIVVFTLSNFLHQRHKVKEKDMQRISCTGRQAGRRFNNRVKHRKEWTRASFQTTGKELRGKFPAFQVSTTFCLQIIIVLLLIHIWYLVIQEWFLCLLAPTGALIMIRRLFVFQVLYWIAWRAAGKGKAPVDIVLLAYTLWTVWHFLEPKEEGNKNETEEKLGLDLPSIQEHNERPQFPEWEEGKSDVCCITGTFGYFWFPPCNNQRKNTEKKETGKHLCCFAGCRRPTSLTLLLNSPQLSSLQCKLKISRFGLRMSNLGS